MRATEPVSQLTAEAEVTVDDLSDPAIYQALVITPANAFASVGDTVQLVVKGVYAEGVEFDLTDLATYASSSDVVATVSADGEVIMAGEGWVRITATFPSTQLGHVVERTANSLVFDGNPGALVSLQLYVGIFEDEEAHLEFCGDAAGLYEFSSTASAHLEATLYNEYADGLITVVADAGPWGSSASGLIAVTHVDAVGGRHRGAVSPARCPAPANGGFAQRGGDAYQEHPSRGLGWSSSHQLLRTHS